MTQRCLRVVGSVYRSLPEVSIAERLSAEPLTDHDGTGEYAIGETEDHMWKTAKDIGW